MINAATKTSPSRPATSTTDRAAFLALAAEVKWVLALAGEPCSPAEVNSFIAKFLRGGNSATAWIKAAEEALFDLRGYAYPEDIDDEESAYEEAMEAAAQRALEDGEYQASLRYGSPKF